MRLAGLVLLLAAAGCVTAASLPAQDSAEVRARELYANKCTACHRLHRPSEYSKEKWPAILDRMAVKAKLTPEQADDLREYLVGRARP